jgi:hypothetical protein
MKYNEKNNLTLFIISLYVESEYIIKSNVYLVTYILLKLVIVAIKCCCLAQNRFYGSCKHMSALLYVLFIIQ